MVKIKNLPEKIYLNLGVKDIGEDIDFKELSEVTWSQDKINDTDIEYTRTYKSLQEILDMLPKEIDFNNKTYSLSITSGCNPELWCVAYVGSDPTDVLNYEFSDTLLRAAIDMINWGLKHEYINNIQL